jgi:hypothetical protein
MSLTNAGIPSSQKDQACTVQARRSTIKDQIPIHRLSYAEYLHDKTDSARSKHELIPAIRSPNVLLIP